MIPIFRAKHHRDNIYFIGSLIGKDDEYYIIEDEDMEYYRPIDPTTLAIHFSDMLDSQGNKIFASLSENGKGGDILKTRGNKAPCKFNKGFTIETIMGISNLYMLLDKVEIIGIQE